MPGETITAVQLLQIAAVMPPSAIVGVLIGRRVLARATLSGDAGGHHVPRGGRPRFLATSGFLMDVARAKTGAGTAHPDLVAVDRTSAGGHRDQGHHAEEAPWIR
ncbi:hypothetical protein [Kutzneria albida]|uniref:Uncharacterized protein n=1 Tax=Kutzneria albida DSM 43870 TaxID=1449976 RepID=W5WBR3_9PSEU|nr:hypothetical protein [Kutzneria albida]AHH98195.1 hypothetical protein KALB_4833 [Kutzneria albida DSM 43870]